MYVNCYEKLINHAEYLGLEVIEKQFKSSAKGLCKGNKIGISKSVENTAEKRCILAEEIAHAFCTTGNILDQRDIKNVKQEIYARRVAYEAVLPLYVLVEAYVAGNKECFEMAEYLEVTEDFLKSALYEYQKKYGLCVRHGKYIIYFSPFRVLEKEVNINDIA